MRAPKRKRDWVGWRVRLLSGMSNGYVMLPAGTAFTVIRAGIITHLMADPCPQCGVRSLLSLKKPDTAWLDFVSPPDTSTL